MLAGVFVFGEMFPLLKGFFESGDLGRLTLPQALHLPYGVVVLLVVLMAVGGFAGAGWVERTMASARPGRPRHEPGAPWTWTRERRLAAAALGLGVLALARQPLPGHSVTIDTRELAGIVSDKADHVTVTSWPTGSSRGAADYRLVDLRTAGRVSRPTTSPPRRTCRWTAVRSTTASAATRRSSSTPRAASTPRRPGCC